MKRSLVFGSWLAPMLTGLLLVGCGSSDSNSKNDGGVGTDATVGSDTAVSVDAPQSPDAPLASDSAVAEVLTAPDAAADAASPDLAVNQDAVTPAEAGTDAAPTPVCTMSPVFTGGMVTKDLILTKACSPFSIKNQIRVESNATLTIEPGVVLLFAKDVELTIGYDGAGKIVAEGTAEAPIVMTSAATTPAAGDWAGIRLYSDAMSGNSLKFVKLDYCGQSNGACVVGLHGVKAGALTVDHVAIDHVGAGADGIAEAEGLSFKITNTTFAAGAVAKGNYAISLQADSFSAIGTGNVFNGAAIDVDGGYVSSDASWINPGTPIVVTGDIRVEGTGSPILTLAAGMTLQFDTGKALWVAYTNAGQLVAEGTATAPIVFTSKSATPGPGDWDGIRLWDGTAKGTKLAYVKLDYCGSDAACIDITNGVKSDRVTIDHVTFDHVGAKNNAIDENGATSRVVISGCTFAPNAINASRYAISVDAASFASITTTNAFSGAPIEIAGGTIDADTKWSDPGTSVVVTGEIRVEGTSTPVLTIGEGMTFKFASGADVWIGYVHPGKLIVNGTDAAHVTFTSLASSPGKGDWDGIVVWNSSQASLTYADVLYAGGDSPAGGVAANSDKASLTLSHTSVKHSAGYGVYIDCDNASVSIDDATCVFEDNADGSKGPGPVCN